MTFRPMIYPADLHTEFTFGKYKGCTIQTIIEDDPSYIQWCLDEVSNFSLTEDAQNLFAMQDWEDNWGGEDAEDERMYGYGGDLW